MRSAASGQARINPTGQCCFLQLRQGCCRALLRGCLVALRPGGFCAKRRQADPSREKPPPMPPRPTPPKKARRKSTRSPRRPGPDRPGRQPGMRLARPPGRRACCGATISIPPSAISTFTTASAARARHIQATFRCLVRQGNIDPKAQESLNGRVHACWLNPASSLPATAAAPPAQAPAATRRNRPALDGVHRWDEFRQLRHARA